MKAGKLYSIAAAFILLNILLPLHAAGTEPTLLPVQVDLHDKAALQRGAAFYMNYCSGCHSLKYMRYNRMAKDLGLTTFSGEVDTDLLVNNLIFTEATPHSPIQIGMPEEDARQWFGVVPPDLSLTARERGLEWIYTYLNSFYADAARPFGANNLLVENVAMPNVLEPLIGRVIVPDPKNKNIESLLLVEQGSMSESQFDSALHDLVTFLAYVGEPAQLLRYKIGVGVLVFLFIFLIVAWLLKKVYWKQLKNSA